MQDSGRRGATEARQLDAVAECDALELAAQRRYPVSQPEPEIAQQVQGGVLVAEQVLERIHGHLHGKIVSLAGTLVAPQHRQAADIPAGMQVSAPFALEIVVELQEYVCSLEAD